MQADLTSLQARHFCRLAKSNGTQAWQHVTDNDIRPQLAFSAQHTRYTACHSTSCCVLVNVISLFLCRGFAEKATQEKPGKTDKAANAANKPAAQPPGSQMRSGMIKAVFISPNVLMEPYRYFALYCKWQHDIFQEVLNTVSTTIHGTIVSPCVQSDKLSQK